MALPTLAKRPENGSCPTPKGELTSWPGPVRGQRRGQADTLAAEATHRDVAGFVGVDLSRARTPVAEVRAVIWLARALDDAGAYAASLHGPDGPPDEPGTAGRRPLTGRPPHLLARPATTAGVADIHRPGPGPCA